MIRRINYTNRIRIPRTELRVSLAEAEEQLLFKADLSGIENRAIDVHHIPPESLVFVEAYRQTDWMRFAFGTVGKLVPPPDNRLSRFSTPEGVRFRVKITSAGKDHRILAEADGIPLVLPGEKPGKQNPLLTVIPSKDLRDEMFRVDFAREQVVLQINNDFGNYREIGRSAAFLSLVLPAVLREILTRILLIDKGIEEYGENDWHVLWIRFAFGHPGIGELPAEDAEDERLEWIDKVVQAFAKRQRCKTLFAEAWKGE